MYSSMPYHYSPSSRRRNKKPSNKKFMRVFCCHGIDSFVVHILRRPFLLVQKKNYRILLQWKNLHTQWYTSILNVCILFIIYRFSISFFWDEIFENILYWANIIFVPNFFFLLGQVSIWPHGYCSYSVVNHLPAFLRICRVEGAMCNFRYHFLQLCSK